MHSYRDHQDDRNRSGDRRPGKPQADGLDNRWRLDRPAEDHHRRTREPSQDNPGGPGGRDESDMNALRTRAILRSTAVMMALCLAFALPQPDVLMAPAFSGYLFAASGAGLLWGLITRPPLRAPYLTHWDQMAFLIAVSLLAGLFTDPEAARQALEAARAGTAG